MFSLIITVVSIALVAVLAFLAIYYGGDDKVKTTFGTMSNPSMNRYTLKSVRLSGAKLRIIE